MSLGHGLPLGLLLAVLAWGGVAGGVQSAAAGSATIRVSVDSAGAAQANGPSMGPSISKNGRYVAFSSRASNLVSGDSNGVGDVFVHDKKTGMTTSADGRFVAFTSGASNLVPGDTNSINDIFVHGRKAGTTRPTASSTSFSTTSNSRPGSPHRV
jgi:hypothetical protein